MTDTLLLTPTISGTDGLSCLARQLRDALGSDGAVPEVADLEAGRAAFAARVLAVAARPRVPRRCVVAHLHLMPAVWPLVWRGTTIVPVLVGIEAWEPLTAARARALRRVTRAIAISHHTVREFRAANPAFAALPVDVCWPATPPLPDAPEGAASGDAGFALIVGRMSSRERYKGHDELIDAWPRVRAVVPSARLVIAGSGDDVDRLQARVVDARLSGAIRFERNVNAARLAQLYRDCAFLALPSRREGFGYVLLEAMRAGKACIAGRGAPEEVVDAGVTGLIVDPTAPCELTTALVTLLQDPARCAQMGAAGRARAREVFSMRRFTADIREALARC